jgi:thioredoxin reductase (NADPH)
MSTEPEQDDERAALDAGLQARASPRLTAADLAEMAEFGTEEQAEAGRVLFHAGEANQDLFVVVEGLVELFRPDGEQEVAVSTFKSGSFIGELSLLTGQRRVLTARVAEPSRIIVIPQSDFRRLMSLRPALGEVILGTLVARREQLRTGQGAAAIRIIGSRFSPEAMSLRAFADHSRLPYTWIDVEQDGQAEALLSAYGLGREDTPAVITSTERLSRPSPAVLDSMGAGVCAGV